MPRLQLFLQDPEGQVILHMLPLQCAPDVPRGLPPVRCVQNNFTGVFGMHPGLMWNHLSWLNVKTVNLPLHLLITCKHDFETLELEQKVLPNLKRTIHCSPAQYHGLRNVISNHKLAVLAVYPMVI